MTSTAINAIQPMSAMMPGPRWFNQSWPLGAQEVGWKLRSALDQLERDGEPSEIEFAVSGELLRCRVSPLRRLDAQAGTVMVLRKAS